MVRKGFLTNCLVCVLYALAIFHYNANAGTDENAIKQKVKETEYYGFSVPGNWREMDMKTYGPEFFFEASGRAFPPTYARGPLIVVVVVMEQEAASLEDAKEIMIKTYTDNPDRVLETGFTHNEEKVTLRSGQKAYFLSTRFYRKSKGLYQNRLDLVTFSERKKTAYVFSTSIQHVDSTYSIQDKLGFIEYIKNIYETFVLK